MSQVVQKEQRGHPHQLRMGSEEEQGPDGVGLLPGESRAPLRRERFRQDERAVEGVQQAQAAGHPEGKAERVAAEESPQRRAQHEAESEGGPQHAEARRPFLGRRDVRDIRAGRGEACGGDPRDHAAHEEPAQGRGDRHEQIVEPQAQA